jgi:small multidrug resistance family-3 protein
MTTLAIYVAAAIAEIAGCFALWAVARLGASPLWLAPGVMSLVLFGWLLTRVDVEFAGRAYAVYGGIYIACALAWLWAVEGRMPDRWDILGAAISITGALVILYAPRAT